ncbi:MAG: hypothetical protein K0S29_336 [Gammaproteobacteria bacterium]|nr:hypothetical protein [Gammaproteobacteria bacterium]
MIKSKKVAIVQSCYIPWKGFFDLINMVDEFILYDDVQYTRRDWRNRNKIRTANGAQWLSIPVEVKGKYLQKINEAKISDANWGKEHWSTIKHNYAKAPNFKEFKDIFEEIYLNYTENSLSLINYKFLTAINEILGIKTKISWSNDYELLEGKTERLLGLCKAAKATEYISGPLAKDYLDQKLFEQENIKVSWMDYSNYPEYKQLYTGFDHYVSIIDMLFNLGQDTTKFMKSFNHRI